MTFDFIILGAGSSGCVVANRLSQDAKRRVLVIEAGGSHHSPLVTIPAGEALLIGNPRYDWRLKADSDPTLNERQEPWARGKVLGGSSSINGMMWVRGLPEDFDHWAEIGNTGWAYEDVLPYFRRAEASDLEDDRYHGREGPVRVSGVASPHPLARIFLNAADELGLPRTADMNGEHAEGIGPIFANIARGRRVSMASAYLDPIRFRNNLSVLTGVTVDRVLIESGRAVGVRCLRPDGSAVEFRCSGEVVVCAGAIMSPAILMRSGIGPGHEMTAQDIPVVSDRPGVGANLQEHATVWCKGYVNVSTYNTELAPQKWVKHGLNWLLFGRGPAASPIAQVGGFVRLDPQSSLPDLQINLIPTGYSIDAGKLTLMDKPAVAVALWQCRPESRGAVVLASADARAAPIIRGRLLDTPKDVDITSRGLMLARRLLQTNAFAPFFEGFCDPTLPVKNDDPSALEGYIRQNAGPAAHPVGTCRMGTDRESVVDARLRVHEISHLRVADASIMPTVTSGNTNAPSVMIGERAADLIAADC